MVHVGKLQYSTNRYISACMVHVGKITVQYKPVVYLHKWYMWENYITVQTGSISACKIYEEVIF